MDGRVGAIRESATVGAWRDYDAWNVAVGAEIFNGQWRGKPVYIDPEQDVLQQIATRAGGPAEAPERVLARIIRGTLCLPPDPRSAFSLHVARAGQWMATGMEDIPPFLAVLTFLSLVAEGMKSDSEFRASNYYGRLCRELDLDADGRLCVKLRRDFDDTHQLWNALNIWLDEHERELGLPTAYAFDYRVHIGIPMSQALVRAADREKLRQFFMAGRFSPRQQVSPTDMERLLAAWLPGSSVSSGLKSLWKRAGAKERIAEVASLELQAWGGEADGGSSPVRRLGYLALIASVRHHPRQRLDLGLIVQAHGRLPAGRYVLTADAVEAARAAFETSGGELRLSDSASDGLMEVASHLVSIPDLLVATIELPHESLLDAQVRREPRRLILLEYDEDYRRYVETRRAQLGRSNLLLAHSSLARLIEALLAQSARPGYVRHQLSELPGLPEGWVAFEGVELIAIPDTTDPDLSAMVPVSWTQVTVAGGLKLPGHMIWHRDAPPEIRVSSFLDEPAVVTLSVQRSLNGAVELGERRLTELNGTDVLALDGQSLPDGDYRVAISRVTPSGHVSRTLDHAVFRLRSADHPRRVRTGSDGLIGHDLGQRRAWSAVSAVSVESSVPSAVRGAVIPNFDEPLYPDGRLPPPSLPLPTPFDPETEDDSAPPPQSRMRAASVPECLGGAHVWFLDRVLPSTNPKWVGGKCQRCGLERDDFPARPPREPKVPRGSVSVKPQTRTAAPQSRQLARALPPVAFKWASPDVLLDALCFARRDTWPGFERIASQGDDAPWFPREFARLLSALGHLDLILHEDTLRPREWSITPACLALLPQGDEAVLCGHRSQVMIETLGRAVEERGAEVELHDGPESPKVVLIRGLREPELREISETVIDRIGIEIQVSAPPASRLLAPLPPVREVVQALPVAVPPASVEMERFDLSANAWVQARLIDRAGAYRFRSLPWIYGYVSNEDIGQGHVRLGDSRLVKWLAAWELRVPLLAYDRSQEKLICRLGAEPPGLYERVAVLCTGQPPTRRVDGTVEYAGVPREIASGLWSRLYECAPSVRVQ